MNREYRQVRIFHKAFGHPVADTPTPMAQDRAEVRAKWMREEIQEFLDARKEATVELEVVTAQADGMIDLIYFALGTLVEMGVEPDILFSIVQQANMSKLHPDGKPRFKPDGKILKPEGWQAPEPKLKEEIRAQIWDASANTPPAPQNPAIASETAPCAYCGSMHPSVCNYDGPGCPKLGETVDKPAAL